MPKLKLPILWPPHVKSWLIGKDPDAGRDWGQGEKGTTEDEMVAWHHWHSGHGFGWTPGVGDGQGGLACCGSRGCKESDTTERLNWTKLMPSVHTPLHTVSCIISILYYCSIYVKIAEAELIALVHYLIKGGSMCSIMLTFLTPWTVACQVFPAKNTRVRIAISYSTEIVDS